MADSDPVAEAYEAAAATWPGVRVDLKRFEAFVGPRLGDRGWAEADGAGLYLACACLDGEPNAVRAFGDRHTADIDFALARLGYTGARADDLRSAVLEKLFSVDPPKIGTYRGTGGLANWVRAVAANEAMSHGRTSSRRDSLLEAAGPGLAPSDVELAYLKEHYRRAFREAFDHAVAGLSAQHRTVLRYRFVDNLTLDQLAVACGVHRATAARRLAVIRQELLDATRARLQTRLSVDRLEFESIIRLIQSNFDVSVRRMLNRSG